MSSTFCYGAKFFEKQYFLVEDVASIYCYKYNMIILSLATKTLCYVPAIAPSKKLLKNLDCLYDTISYYPFQRLLIPTFFVVIVASMYLLTDFTCSNRQRRTEVECNNIDGSFLLTQLCFSFGLYCRMFLNFNAWNFPCYIANKSKQQILIFATT